MADTPADIIRVFDTPANLALNLKNKMIGYDITNGRFAAKNTSGVMKYVSEDSLQCLLAGTQTITGLKTFSQNILMTATKLLSLDGTGGLRLQSASLNSISDDDSLYTLNKLLGVYGGELEVLDHGNLSFDSILSNGIFFNGDDWTLAGDFAIGSGTLNYTHSTGAGTAEQAKADYQERAYDRGDWYLLSYDVDSYSGDAVVEIHTDTVATAVPLDMTVASGNKVYFQFKASHTKFKISVTSTSGSFSIDNMSIVRVFGAVNATKFGPGGSVFISGDGDIESNLGNDLDSGWFGPPGAGRDQMGLQFNSEGNGRFSRALDIGWGGDLSPTTDQSAKRMAIEKPYTGQTVNANTLNISLQLNTFNDSIGVYLIFIAGLKDDSSLGYGQVIQITMRDDSVGTLVKLGSATVGAVHDEFGDVVVATSASGSNLLVSITGSAGDTIDWSVQTIGHGNLHAERF